MNELIREMNKITNQMSLNSFIAYIICAAAGYARANGYDENDAVKKIGQYLTDITEVAEFNGWKG